MVLENDASNTLKAEEVAMIVKCHNDINIQTNINTQKDLSKLAVWCQV